VENLQITSLQSENGFQFHEKLANYLRRELKIDVFFNRHSDWRFRREQFYLGNIQLATICGLPYVLKEDQGANPMELIAAPILENSRYFNEAVYFSEIIVNANSEYFSWEDLRGKVWAYNENLSQSGFNLLLYQLATMKEDRSYFAQFIESGSHLRSLDWIEKGKIAAAAIDSSVLEAELLIRPELKYKIRIIDSLGPSRIPPLVIHKDVPITLKNAVKESLLGMHTNEKGQQVLRAGLFKKFIAIQDDDYDDIRRMYEIAKMLH